MTVKILWLVHPEPIRHSRPSAALQALRMNFSQRLKAGIHQATVSNHEKVRPSSPVDSRLRGNDGGGEKGRDLSGDFRR